MATSFSNDSATRRRFSSGHGSVATSACASLKATPAPHRFLSGYWQSGRLGLSTASAGGSSASGRWWSVTITSMESSPACRTTSPSRMPLSTLTIRRTPSAAAASTISGRIP